MSEVESIHACMLRLRDRYKVAWATGRGGAMSKWDCDRLRIWFRDRMEYLQGEYARAINEADNIIGKQYHYANTVVKLYDF